MASRTPLFLSDRSQAARMPEAVAFGETVRDVVVRCDGKRRVTVPADVAWDDLFEQAGVEMPDRDQPSMQVRERF